ncbi:hypothetical protein [Vreelandella neptunia]|uniref:Uncharacterized protein n=1 Tax=Vreelandella neptunia TaxID=115551 RepID=A0ABZ0YR03_9GAMM|nr:hypothetical protein [Halomonas neptunia]MDN3561688.1 hypothetical protein [Halomonas neptunia]WQH14590.1 hypothetical protein SR894_08635 [Halomonas neptunia]
MSKLLRRLLFVIRASRTGRGDELDRVMVAMEEGARFKGAKGYMLLALAKDKRWVEMNMRMDGNAALSDAALGKAWALRMKDAIKAARKQKIAPEELR